MVRVLASLTAAVLVLGACTGEDDPIDAVPTPVATTDGGGTDQADEPAALSTDDPAVRDAVLLTAIDEVLADTRYADLVDEDPGAFLETADTLCASLDDGGEVDDVLGAFLATLRDEGLDLDEDTAYLGGALLGAAVTVRCPEHEAAVAEETA